MFSGVQRGKYLREGVILDMCFWWRGCWGWVGSRAVGGKGGGVFLYFIFYSGCGQRYYGRSGGGVLIFGEVIDRGGWGQVNGNGRRYHI